MKLSTLSLMGVIAVTMSSVAHADTFTVNGTDVVFAAGTQSNLGAHGTLFGNSGGGTLPVDVTISSGSTSLTITATGSVTEDGIASHAGDPDGSFARVPTSSNTGFGSISGITAPGAGYLLGVFIGAGGPSGAAPTALDFTSTSFTSLSPLLDQTFFIGDGLTGDGTGSIQSFIIPAGATDLYLGLSDAGGFNGPPFDYGDNIGSFSVTTTAVGVGTQSGTTPTPEPSSLVLLGTGAVGSLAIIRRRLTGR